MLAKLMLRQKTIMPVEQMVMSSMAIDWADEMSREELVVAWIRQLELRPEDIKRAMARLEKAQRKNKERFSQVHRLAPTEENRGWRLGACL